MDDTLEGFLASALCGVGEGVWSNELAKVKLRRSERILALMELAEKFGEPLPVDAKFGSEGKPLYGMLEPEHRMEWLRRGSTAVGRGSGFAKALAAEKFWHDQEKMEAVLEKSRDAGDVLKAVVALSAGQALLAEKSEEVEKVMASSAAWSREGASLMGSGLAMALAEGMSRGGLSWSGSIGPNLSWFLKLGCAREELTMRKARREAIALPPKEALAALKDLSEKGAAPLDEEGLGKEICFLALGRHMGKLRTEAVGDFLSKFGEGSQEASGFAQALMESGAQLDEAGRALAEEAILRAASPARPRRSTAPRV